MCSNLKERMANFNLMKNSDVSLIFTDVVELDIIREMEIIS